MSGSSKCSIYKWRKIKKECDGVTHDYTKKEKVLAKNIILPDHMPKEFNDRSTLWNKVEMAEKILMHN